jgi:hypothetical protein
MHTKKGRARRREAKVHQGVNKFKVFRLAPSLHRYLTDEINLRIVLDHNYLRGKDE